MEQKVILFDLDGTLTDSGEGIINCVVFALEHFGLPIPPTAELRSVVGPPLHDSLARYGVPKQKLDEGVTVFRSRYNPIGIYENVPYPGIREALEELVKRLDRSMDEQENARIDKQIHFTLALASGNVLLLNILEACSGVIDTFIRNMRAEILRTKEAKAALNLCHRQIAEALRNKDNAAGKDALDRHFRMIDEILEKHEKTHSM